MPQTPATETSSNADSKFRQPENKLKPRYQLLLHHISHAQTSNYAQEALPKSKKPRKIEKQLENSNQPSAKQKIAPIQHISRKITKRSA
jgi:hypothetical protein